MLSVLLVCRTEKRQIRSRSVNGVGMAPTWFLLLFCWQFLVYYFQHTSFWSGRSRKAAQELVIEVNGMDSVWMILVYGSLIGRRMAFSEWTTLALTVLASMAFIAVGQTLVTEDSRSDLCLLDHSCSCNWLLAPLVTGRTLVGQFAKWDCSDDGTRSEGRHFLRNQKTTEIQSLCRVEITRVTSELSIFRHLCLQSKLVVVNTAKLSRPCLINRIIWIFVKFLVADREFFNITIRLGFLGLPGCQGGWVTCFSEQKLD